MYICIYIHTYTVCIHTYTYELLFVALKPQLSKQAARLDVDLP